MATIQLLVTDGPNRRALASLVGERHTTVTETEFQPADLYIVDDVSFPQYQETIEERKHEQSPVFCPVILIRRDQTPIHIDLPEPDVGNRPLLVNEIMSAPVEKQQLFRSIANLLARRAQTKELHEANERLEKFARTLKHELRNPLTVLNGYLGIARESCDLEALETCQRAVDQMESLLEGTLLILEEDNHDIGRVPIDLGAISEVCWERVSESTDQLEVETSQQIYADEDRLTQLLGNLFRNAVEHSCSPVTVKVGELDDGFYVEDNGSGIPEEERDIVFEEGYSTNSAKSGLGLPVVKAVVDAHGWTIRLTEGEMGGARFEITGVKEE